MNRTICAIDVETTGVDCLEADIVEIAILPAKYENHELVIDKDKIPLSILVKPDNFEVNMSIDENTRDAIYFNKISPELIVRDGLEPDAVLPYIKGWMAANGIKHMTPLGHNFSFDRTQLHKHFGKDGFESIMHHRYKDSHTSALFINDWAELKEKMVPFKSTRLVDIAKHFGWGDTDGAHRALYDCEMTIFVYNKLIELAETGGKL